MLSWQECLAECKDNETLATSLFHKNIISSHEWSQMFLSDLKIEEIHIIEIIQYLKHYPYSYSCAKSLLIDLIAQFFND